MVKRYTINSEFVFKDCLVTPSVYEGVLQRFDEYHCFRSTCWLNRIKQAIENCYQH